MKKPPKNLSFTLKTENKHEDIKNYSFFLSTLNTMQGYLGKHNYLGKTHFKHMLKKHPEISLETSVVFEHKST